MTNALTTVEIQRHLDALRGGSDPAAAAVARERLLDAAGDRLRHLTGQMLRQYGSVRVFEQTDDVFDGAVTRLTRALGDERVLARLASTRDFLGLAAAQIRRELIDLACHYAGGRGQFPAPDLT